MSDNDSDWLAKELKKNHIDRRWVYLASVIGVCLLVGISVLVYHSAKHNEAVKLTDSSAASPIVGGNDTLTIGGSASTPPSSATTSPTTSKSATTNLVNNNQPSTTPAYKPPVYTSLQASDITNYNNLFSQFTQLDNDMTAGNYSAAYQVSVTSDDSIGDAAEKVAPSLMSNYIYYTSAIEGLIGKISAQIPSVNSDYDTSITDFQNYNSSSDQSDSSAQIVLQNAQSQLAAARSGLSQIQGYYNQIPQ
jgi:hypothetical protein